MKKTLMKGKSNNDLRNRIFFFSSFGLLVFGISSTIIGPTFPHIYEDFSLSMGMLGFLASAWSVGYLFTVVAGRFSDRYGELLILTIGLIVCGVSIGLMSVAPNYQLLWLLFFFVGVGGGFLESSMNPLISRLYPNKRGFVMNVLHLFWNIGAFIGPALAGYLIVKFGGWRLPYLFTAFIFAPFIVMGIYFLRKREMMNIHHTESIVKMNRKDLISLGIFVIIGFLYWGAELGTNAWLPSFLMFERGFPLALASFSMSLFYAFMGGGRLIFGNLVDRFSYKRIIICCSLLSSLCLSTGTLVENHYLITVLWSLAGFTIGPIYPTLLAWANTLFPSRGGFATGSIITVASLGGIFSPWFIGVMAELFTLSNSILYLTVAALLIGFIAILLKEDK